MYYFRGHDNCKRFNVSLYEMCSLYVIYYLKNTQKKKTKKKNNKKKTKKQQQTNNTHTPDSKLYTHQTEDAVLMLVFIVRHGFNRV